jgi:hypothetical protein
MKAAFDIIKASDNYKHVISTITNDLNFWKQFLALSITNYQKQEVKPEEIYSSIFTTYDIDPQSNIGHLATSNKPTSIMTVDLEGRRLLFFSWIMNLSILKSYNALEIFLLSAIWLKYFRTLNNPTEGKRSSDVLQKEIKKELSNSGLTADTKNNRHLIQFVRSKSKGFEKLLTLSIRVDLTTTWENFFEMISILRNIIAHQGTIITQDTLNGIKSKSRDIFERHFYISSDDNGDKHINPKEIGLTSLIGLMNDFGLNSVKLIYNQPDLKFMNMVLTQE